MATSASGAEIRTFVLMALCRGTRWLRPGYDALQVPEMHRGVRIVSPRMIRLAHGLGLDVHVWTVDDAPTMRKLLAWGADGVMTDRPDVLALVLGERE